MKTTLIIILLTFCSLSFGQTFLDENTKDDDFITFIAEDTIEFKVTIGECITSKVYGYGPIKSQRNRIIVHTIRPNSEKHSNYKIIDTIQPNKIDLQVFVQGKPLYVGNVFIFMKDRKNVIVGTITNKEGKASLHIPDSYTIDNLFISISFVEYDSYSIPLKNINGKSVIINLSPYLILDDKKVIFKKTKVNGEESLRMPKFKIN